MIIVMMESSDQERESIRKELGKREEEPKEVVAAAAEVLGVDEKPSVLDYKSEDRPALAKTKIHQIELTTREEKLQEKYKTPDQLLDEDYKVAPTSADKEKVEE
jgi:hypothetical protein